MPSYDLTRHATNFAKRYSGVRMQQGRILTDDDFNEHARLDDERERRTNVDVIGPAGSNDSGLGIANPQATAAGLDFTIQAGTFYLGGLPIEMDAPETYLLQRDWLRRPPLTAPAGERLDLVYLEAWRQPVTAVEDEELFEVGLATGDTSARTKLMRRIRVAEGAGQPDCREAWTAFLQTLASQGTLNDENEWVSDTKLRVTYAPPSNPGDLCNPPVAGGYLGAENQLIRVELSSGNTFKWGYDNAQPLYRVSVRTNGAGERRIIHMITEPRDQAHWPLAGQIVEFLPWSAVLPNGEKVAETAGFLARVDSSYNPDAGLPPGEFGIAVEVPPGFGAEWQTRGDAGQLGDEFLYMRLWNRGADVTSPLEIPIAPNVPLGATGLRVTFSGADRRPTDHWLIAARPETPDQVVPWDFDAGRPANGFRRFLAPLGIIRWTATRGAVQGELIDDCRPPFLPLTRLRGCCTFTVGDGENSFGQFTSIQEAIDRLPPGGGDVCILNGVYRQDFSIVGRANVRVHGCGTRTRLLGAPDRSGPLVVLSASQNVRVASISIIAGSRIGLAGESGERGRLLGVVIEDLNIECADREAIQLRAHSHVTVRNCRIDVWSLGRNLSAQSIAGKCPAMFIRADDVLIEGNSITCSPKAGRFQAPLGGLQIGGGSERVEIRRNRITGGNGNGITLGSIRWVSGGAGSFSEFIFGVLNDPVLFGFVSFDEDGCPEIDPDPGPPVGPDGRPLTPVSEGALREIRIVDNEIRLMGVNGIAVARFGAGLSRILIFDLTVEWNRIESCMGLTLQDRPALSTIPFGGIVLQDCEQFTCRWNRIQGNGASHGDPIVGIFAGSGEALAFEGNHIVENGPHAGSTNLKLNGLRGGILVKASALTAASYKGESGEVQYGPPALKVHGNVVQAPLGPALLVRARGPVFVEGNQLVSHGTPPRDEQPGITSAAVIIGNLGFGGEFIGLLQLAAWLLGDAIAPDAEAAIDELAASATRIPNGLVMFNDNQVILDTRSSIGSRAFASTLIFSFDDVSFAGNQLSCETREILLTDAFLMGWSMRVHGNRFQEIPARAILSAFTFAPANFTVDNIGTHCVVAYPTPKTVGSPNVSILFPEKRCLDAAASLKNTMASGGEQS